MADTREEILKQMLVVARKVRNVSTAERNLPELSDESALPALIIFDGDEVADTSDPVRRPPAAIRRVTMMPEIRILVATASDTVGKDLNALRAALITAMMGDATLIGLSADGVGIRYDGASTQMKVGRSMTGDMLASFSITYYLKPSDP